MAAFIPSRRDAAANERAFAKVREDKTREAGAGFDGSWVAHPDLVTMCDDIFTEILGERSNQLDVLRDDVVVSADDRSPSADRAAHAGLGKDRHPEVAGDGPIEVRVGGEHQVAVGIHGPSPTRGGWAGRLSTGSSGAAGAG